MLEVVHTLELGEQRELLDACRKLVGESPLFVNVMPSGKPFRYRGTCAGELGWVTDAQEGYRYTPHHLKTGQPWPQIPELVLRIVRHALEPLELEMEPQAMLLNWYEEQSSLGLHVDNTEQCDAPVVSISLGDDAVFAIGGLERGDSTHSIRLRSGDVLVMAGEHRFVHHGVRRIVPGTAPALLGMRGPGRINLTVRQVSGR